MFRGVRGFITMGYFSPVHDYSGSPLARGGDWPVTRAPRSPATRGFTVFARTRGSVTGSRQERKARCWDARGSCPPLGRPGPCRSGCEGRGPRQREVFSLLLHRRGNRGPERKRLWSPPPGGAWLAVLAERGWRARSPGGTPVEKGQQRRCTGGQATVTGVGAGPP